MGDSSHANFLIRLITHPVQIKLLHAIIIRPYEAGHINRWHYRHIYPASHISRELGKLYVFVRPGAAPLRGGRSTFFNLIPFGRLPFEPFALITGRYVAGAGGRRVMTKFFRTFPGGTYKLFRPVEWEWTEIEAATGEMVLSVCMTNGYVQW